MVIIRIVAQGLKDGREHEAIVDLFDYYDEASGFMARRQTPSGGIPVELAVPSQVFVEEFRKRGFDLRVSM